MPSASSIFFCIFRVRDRLVLAGDDARPGFDHGDPAAEAAVHLRELKADIAAADDQKVLGQKVHFHHARVGQVVDFGQAWDVGRDGAAAGVDEDFAGFEHLVADPHRAPAFEAGMSVDQSEIGRAAQPVGKAASGFAYHLVLARLHPGHVHPDRAVQQHTVVGRMARHMRGARAGDQGFGRDAANVHAGAADVLALDDRGFPAGLGQAYRQRRAGLAGTDDDGVGFLVHLV